MEEYAAESYVERSRRDRHADMSVVVGLSWRVKGHQAHADYTGGLDTARIWQSLASLRDLSLSETLSRLWHTQGENVVVIPGARQAEPKSVGGRQATTGWRHALARAAPADLQRPSGCRCDGETPEARRDRMRAEHEQKARGSRRCWRASIRWPWPISRESSSSSAIVAGRDAARIRCRCRSSGTRSSAADTCFT